MRLGDYLERHRLTQTEFAKVIGADQGQIARYVSGERLPRRDVMQRIIDATHGEVTANDFFKVPDSRSTPERETV